MKPFVVRYGRSEGDLLRGASHLFAEISPSAFETFTQV